MIEDANPDGNVPQNQALNRHLMTLEALAEVDAGRFIDASEIDAWLESLED